MRTSKKNESGILNHSICSSNEDYATWRKGDPKASGFTFSSMSYPGKQYNVGSMFREKDMGNLLKLLFTAGDYFRGKDLELVTDSHFGHLTPLVYARLWKVYITSSFTVSQRLGISAMTQLSNKKMEKNERDQLLEDLHQEMKEEKERKFDPLESDSDISDYCEEVAKGKKKTFRALKSRLDFFEYKLRSKRKGHFLVWKTSVTPVTGFRVNLFLHAVNDSKPVYRISNKYGAKPSVKMNFTVKDDTLQKKVLKEQSTTKAHKMFRFGMGFNDGSDRLRSRIGLSGRYYRAWPKHLVANTLEDAIINAYGNYLLDPNCKVESFTDFLIWLVDELISSGTNLRKQLMVAPKRSYRRVSKRPRPGSDESLAIGEACRGMKNIGTILFIPYDKRKRMCQFCGRQKAKFKCRSCGSHLCMEPSAGFPIDGPGCFLRFHGYAKFPRM